MATAGLHNTHTSRVGPFLDLRNNLGRRCRSTGIIGGSRRRRRPRTQTSFRSGAIPHARPESVGVTSMNRRQFFLGLIFQERPATLQVEVMEVSRALMDLSRFWSIRPAKPHAAFSQNGFVPITELLLHVAARWNTTGRPHFPGKHVLRPWAHPDV